MDRDPELDVTLSNGRAVTAFQIAALDRARGTWTLTEPGLPPCVICGEAAALTVRQRLDARIAARLAAGWVPVERLTPAAPVPLPTDLALQIRSLIEALARARRALLAADPNRGGARDTPGEEQERLRRAAEEARAEPASPPRTAP
jgi:hypothetical protein